LDTGAAGKVVVSRRVDEGQGRMHKTVALLGIGLMGSALAERLLLAGYAVRGFDPSPERMEAFTAQGGQPASSAADAARGAPVTFTCLMTAEIVREALFGEEGAAAAMPPGGIVVDTSTLAPAASRGIAADLADRGLAMLDAPLSGSSTVARAGELLVMAGGPAAAFERCLPLFAAFARSAVHAGPSGAGAAAKLVTNLVLGLNRLALAEGLSLGLSAGLEPPALLRLLRESGAYSRVLDAKGERMVSGRFEPEARLAQHLKDVNLILDLGRELGVALPVSTLHRELLERAVAAGLGELDNSAVLLLLRDLARELPGRAPGA
jgi:3-hydroxyisobutyrate dehydrogenase-like beta-hydroxyacid dehydrogenase